MTPMDDWSFEVSKNWPQIYRAVKLAENNYLIEMTIKNDLRKRIYDMLNTRHAAKFWAGGVDNDPDVIELREIFNEIIKIK